MAKQGGCESKFAGIGGLPLPSADDLAKALFSAFCENPRKLQNPNILGPDFPLNGDFESVFDRFWPIPGVPEIQLFGFYSVFDKTDHLRMGTLSCDGQNIRRGIFVRQNG
jgi:hypothetical protein